MVHFDPHVQDTWASLVDTITIMPIMTCMGAIDYQVRLSFFIKKTGIMVILEFKYTFNNYSEERSIM